MTFASLSTYRRIGDLGMLGGIYLGASLETGNAWKRTEAVTFDSLRVGGSVFLGLDTIIGPLSFAYGIADRGNHSFTIFLGRTF